MKFNIFRRISRRIRPVQRVALGFLVVITLGALLLNTPWATRSGELPGLLNAVFTATTSACVTGLVVFDTFSYWSLFGQLVILVLIQIGGLGFMTTAAIFWLVFQRNIGLSDRLAMSESLNQYEFTGIVRKTRNIIVGAFVMEAVGAVCLSTVFIKDFGWVNGAYKSVFHSISAFCNAGIDLLGEYTPFSSMTYYTTNAVFDFTIMALVMLGGLGITVWEDFAKLFRNRLARVRNKFSLHTKLVLITSACLILGGAIFLVILEYNNPETFGGLSIPSKFMAGLFHSVTTRTAGFVTVDIAKLTDSSKLLLMILMFIGGSPGSAAGGIKTVTFAVVILSVFSAMRGSDDVMIMKKRFSTSIMMRAFSIMIISLAAIVLGVSVLCLTEDIAFLDLLFETISAFSTAGMSLGVTPNLGFASKLTIICLMYAGRVGVLSVAISIATHQSASANIIRYPEEKVTVG